jgi:hypothetical protein
MKMLYPRYGAVRTRLIELYSILNHRVYGVWVAPKSLMTIDDLRGRYHNNQAGFANDHNYYDEPQMRQMKIPQMLGFLPNILSPDELGFQKANETVPNIYESIQEYLKLWCEMIRTVPEFKSPPREELRQLENLAYMLFPSYMKIKPFVTNQAIREAGKDRREHEGMGLASLGMLFTMTPMLNKGIGQEISFVSHLDELDGHENTAYMVDHQAPAPGNFFPTRISVDSLSRVEVQQDTNDWIFRGDD